MPADRRSVAEHASDFGPLLTELRTARGWAQAKLADRSGLDPSSVSRFEAGTRAPERETVLAFADAMALPVIERERLLAAAGFRSEAWDDPLISELVEVLADPTLPDDVAGDLRALLRIAIEHGRRATGRPPNPVPRPLSDSHAAGQPSSTPRR
ncbi:MAG: helix-turn-helix domain-containing protein [Thermomicrobiales bacterium]